MQSSLMLKVGCVGLLLLTLTTANWTDFVDVNEHRICKAINQVFFMNKIIVNVTFADGKSDHCCGFCVPTTYEFINGYLLCEYLLVPANCLKHDEINKTVVCIVSHTSFQLNYLN